MVESSLNPFVPTNSLKSFKMKIVRSIYFVEYPPSTANSMLESIRNSALHYSFPLEKSATCWKPRQYLVRYGFGYFLLNFLK